MCGVTKDVRHREQRMPVRRLLQHVQRRAAEAALFRAWRRARSSTSDSRAVLMKYAPGRIWANRSGGEHPPVLRGQPGVQRDDVRAGQQRVQRHQLDVALVPQSRRLRVVPQHGEAERPGPAGPPRGRRDRARPGPWSSWALRRRRTPAPRTPTRRSRAVQQVRLARGTARISSGRRRCRSATASAFLPGVFTTGMPRRSRRPRPVDRPPRAQQTSRSGAAPSTWR